MYLKKLNEQAEKEQALEYAERLAERNRAKSGLTLPTAETQARAAADQARNTKASSAADLVSAARMAGAPQYTKQAGAAADERLRTEPTAMERRRGAVSIAPVSDHGEKVNRRGYGETARTPTGQATIEPSVLKDIGKKIGNVAGGTAANFVSGVGNPVYVMARIMEIPNDILYAVTKNEKFNLDREPGLRDSAALRASDQFADIAQEASDRTGGLGKQIISTGQAAGNMMSAASLYGQAFGILGNAGTMANLSQAANSSPLLSSPVSRAGAKAALEILGNPGNFGISIGSAVSSYSEALENGANVGQAMTNGIYKGLAEYLSNKLFSGTPFEDAAGEKGYMTMLTEHIANKIGKSDVLAAFNKSTGGKVANWILDKFGEGMEEVVTGVADPLIDKLTYNRNADLATADEIVDEFLGGVILSLLMSGGEALIETAQTDVSKTAAEVEEQLVAMGVDRQTARKYSRNAAKAIIAAKKAAEDEARVELERNEDYARFSQGDPEIAAKGAETDSDSLKRYADIFNRNTEAVADPETANDAAFMTDQEAGNYFYLWSKQGARAADAYYDAYVAPAIESRRAQAEAEQEKLRITAAEERSGLTLPAAEPQTAEQARTEEAPKAAPESGLRLPTAEPAAETKAETQTGGSETKTEVRTEPTTGSTNRRPKQQALVASQRQRKMADTAATTAREAGFAAGDGEAPIYVRSEETWDADERQVAQALRERGIEPVFVTGLLKDSDGNRVTFLREGDRMAIQADNRNTTLQQIAEQALGTSLGIDGSGMTEAAAGVIQKRTETAQKAEAKTEGRKAGTRGEATRQSAAEAGASEADANTAARLADLLGKDIRFFRDEARNGSVINGYTQNGVIYVNAAVSKRTVVWVVAHELTHNTEHAQAYRGLLKLARQYYGKDWDARINARVEMSRSIAEDRGDWSIALTAEEAARELTADYVAERLLTDEEAIRQAVQYDAPTVRRVLAYLKNVLAKLGGKEPSLEWGIDRISAALKESAQAAVAKKLTLPRGNSAENYETNGGKPAPRDINPDFAKAKYSVEPPYRPDTKSGKAFAEGLNEQARDVYDMFLAVHEASERNTAVMEVGAGKSTHSKRVPIADRFLTADEWNAQVKSNPEFAQAAKNIFDVVPKDIRKTARLNDDGTITETGFEKHFKMARSLVQRLVDALPKGVVGSTVELDGKDYQVARGRVTASVGGEEYRRALVAEKRKLFKAGKLPTRSIDSLSHDNWGAMGFLATNTKTIASGDFTTFCPQMYFNDGCWYCYRRAALTTGINNKLTAETVWYAGEILQLRREDIDRLNEVGGLRIQSFGDWQSQYSTMLADLLIDAEKVGLQIKVITKEPSMIDTVALLKEQGLGKSLYFNLSADYTIERRGTVNNTDTENALPMNPERPFLKKENAAGEEETWWKRALTVQEANEFRKQYDWVNTRIVATNADEFIRGLKDPTVDVVTGYHGTIRQYERVSSETGEVLMDVEPLGDSGMPRFAFNPKTGKWTQEYEGKTKYQKELARRIREEGLEQAYYNKSCCIFGRCAKCKGKCGSYARSFAVKNATNRDQESVKYWQKEMDSGVDNPLLESQQEGKLRLPTAEGAEKQTSGLKLPVATDEKKAAGTKAAEQAKYSMEEDHAAYKGKSMTEDKELYDYDFLVARSPMIVRELPPLSATKINGEIDADYVGRVGMEKAGEIGRPITDSVVGIRNRYTDIEIHLSKDALVHGVGGENKGRTRTNARLALLGGDIVQNAIPVNALHPMRQAKGTYAMAALLGSGDRAIVAIVHVDQYMNATSFEFDHVAHSVNGRLTKQKIEDIRSSTRETPSMGATDAFDTITIADFLSIVNETHQSILSDDVLEHYGETRNPTGHYNGRVKYSAEDYAPTFYSKLERELEAYKGGKLGAASVESYLRGHGVKEEEIKWSGIRQFLEGKKSVTKAELLDFVRANRIEIEEETLGGPETLSYTDEERDDLHELEADRDRFLDEAAEYWREAYGEEMPLEILARDDPGRSLMSAVIRKSGMSFRDFTAENLGETERALYGRGKALLANERAIDDIVRQAKERTGSIDKAAKWKDYSQGGGKNYREILFRNPASDYSNSAMAAHWGDRTGVLAHARVQDFTSDGEPVLYVEEIQSDWHNAGQKEGYTSEKDLSEKQKKISALERKTRASEDRFYEVVYELLPVSGLKIGDNKLDAYDVEYGLLGIGSSTRYRAKLMEMLSEEDRRFVEEYAAAVKELEKERDTLRNAEKIVPDAPYANTYHEFVLKSLLRQAAENGYGYVAWTTGKMQEERWSKKYAEGYRIEYDQNIPKFLNKYGKQWGAKVTEITLDENGVTVPAIQVTDAMKQSVLHEGQPQYSAETAGEGLNSASMKGYNPDMDDYDREQLNKRLDALYKEYADAVNAPKDLDPAGVYRAYNGDKSAIERMGGDTERADEIAERIRNTAELYRDIPGESPEDWAIRQYRKEYADTDEMLQVIKADFDEDIETQKAWSGEWDKKLLEKYIKAYERTDFSDLESVRNLLATGIEAKLKNDGEYVLLGHKYKDGTKFSAEDEDYMAAVEAGDMETAQRMVDEAAKKAGYRVERYHGTKANFNKFNPDFARHGGSGFGYYFGDKALADEFGEGGRVIRVLLNDKAIGTLKTHNITADGFEDALKKLGLSPEKTYMYMGAESAEEYVKAHHDYRLATDLQYWAIDPDRIAEIADGKEKTPREIISILKNTLGLDGIERGREVILWDNTLMKLADPVTYDDNGNVIPLSERFNPEQEDIRYSAEDEDTVTGRKLLGTTALDRIGVKVSGSVGQYGMTESLLAKDKAAKSLARETRKAEKRLSATAKEKEFANGIAAGVYSEDDIPASMNRNTVLELADYYWAQQSANLDTLHQLRSDINKGLQDEAKTLLEDADITPQSMLKLNERTPERSFRAMFGDRAEAIAKWALDPVRENEAEKIRWYNKQMDAVREFTDSKGKSRRLTKEERALTMRYMEGRAAADMVAGMEAAATIRKAANRIKNGEAAGDVSKDYGLKYNERDLAEKLAGWMQTLEDLRTADTRIVEEAAKKYSEIFDQYYAAINDFLVAHGYEPIGYIKGYAPHMQPEENQTLLNRAFKALGVNTEVTELPASIAGQTAFFKPNKRWNPYFLQRTGKTADYDIERAYQSYVDYMADVLYHTDDVMRIRQMANWIRKTYAPEEIRQQLEQARELNGASTEEKQQILRDAGKISTGTVLSPTDTQKAMQDYVDELYENIGKTTQHSNLVMWLENYANILAGKQSFADRGWEYSTGRKSLNWANRLNNAFQKANVAGNLSSILNQTAQIPMIYAELGERDFTKALLDMVSGKTRAWAADSDFLTAKAGKEMLFATNAEKFINALFAPAGFTDALVSTVAVRGAYNKYIRQGMSHAEAMEKADAFGAAVMGSRAKGSRPLAYESKGFFSKMVHMFQVEAVNSWDHIATDLPYEIRRIAKTQGKPKAAAALAALILRALMGAFVLNRLTDELYGGTPAPFDILGLAANFVASGKGLSTNAYVRTVMDNVLEKNGAGRVFGTEAMTKEDFDRGAATGELIYNVMNDVPLVRNLAGVLGWGDQTVPLPGMDRGELKAMWDAVMGMLKDGADPKEVENLLRASLQTATQFVPGGRQLRKLAEGAEAAIRGGSYKNGKLQYPVEGASDLTKALLFGKNATNAAKDYWAAGGTALSEKQTGLYEDLVDEGMSRREAYGKITGYKEAGTLDTFTRWTDSQAKAKGVDEQTYIDFREATSGMTTDKDANGKKINGSLKAKVVAYIDSLPLTWDQKTALLKDYDPGYADVTWSGSGLKLPTATSKTTTPAPTEAPMSAKAQGYYDGFKKAGVTDATAKKLATTLEKSDASGHEQWRVIYNAAGNEGEKAVTSVMTDEMKRNWNLAKSAGVSMNDYIKVRESYVDLDEDGYKDQKEWNATLNGMTFSSDSAEDKKIKGTLWQILTGSTSTKNNPYDKSSGQKVIDAKAGGSSGGQNAMAAFSRTLKLPTVEGQKPTTRSRLRLPTA